MNMFDKICARIDSMKSDAVELQTLLTCIPALAPESGGQGELTKCESLSLWLTAHGFAQQQRFDAPDSRVESGVRPNLIVTVPGTDTEKKLWILSHLDVVPAGERSLWHTEPFSVVEKDGRLYGRGTEDDQQGIVCSIMALYALLQEGVVPAYTVKLLFVADEEVGSTFGIQYLQEHHALFAPQDVIITPDGGDPKGETIEIAEKNLLWLRILTKGKQAHGSMPDDGVNAHLASCALALSLNQMEKDFTERNALFSPDRSTFQPTKKESNVPNVNTIPGEDVFYMDCRILPCYTLAHVRTEIRRRMDAVEKQYGVIISFTEEQAVESPATPQDAEAVTVLADAVRRVLHLEPRIVGIGGGTVAACLRKAGLNAVVWSLQDETMHQPDEYCVIENLFAEAKVLASVMIKNTN